jgi:hypothetical protein
MKMASGEETDEYASEQGDKMIEELKLLPDNVRVLLEQQYEGAKQNHDRVRQLRNPARQSGDNFTWPIYLHSETYASLPGSA